MSGPVSQMNGQGFVLADALTISISFPLFQTTTSSKKKDGDFVFTAISSGDLVESKFPHVGKLVE